MPLPLRNSRIKLPLGQIFWREVGQGPILVFLHGTWNDSSQWLPIIEHLGKKYHCLAPDLLGFGDSEQPKLHYSLQLEVECLLHYLQMLHLSPVYLIAHSFGAWVAASYALQYRSQVHGLVLIAPEGVEIDRYWGQWRRKRWLVGQPPIAYGMLRTLYPLARLLGVHKRIELLFRQRQQLLSSTTACHLLFRRRRSEIQAELLQARLNQLTVPTLILQGDKDTPEAIARSQIYAHHTPTAQLITLEQGDRDLPEALPELMARYIHNFVVNSEHN